RVCDILSGLRRPERFGKQDSYGYQRRKSARLSSCRSLHLCAQENGLLTVEAMDYNLNELPEGFGGMSGGGLWHIYFVEDEKESRVIATMLCGIASWQIDDRKIACQGWD